MSRPQKLKIKHPRPEQETPAPPPAIPGAQMGRRVSAVALKPEGNGYRCYLLALPQEVIDAYMIRHDGPQLADEAHEFTSRYVDAVVEGTL